MSKRLLIFILICFSTFIRCSWQEYFVIKNNSEQSVKITCQMNEIKSGEFALFTNEQRLYSLTKKGTIDWDKKLDYIDEDKDVLKVQLILPPKSILIFGTLNNDHYEKHDQYFINSRNFNLKQLEIHTDSTLTITPRNFDVFFTKKDGQISYTIK